MRSKYRVKKQFKAVKQRTSMILALTEYFYIYLSGL